MQGIKKFFELFRKGFVCLRKNGITYTLKKIKWRMAENTSYQENVAKKTYKPGEPITILTTKHTLYVAHLIENSLRKIQTPVKVITKRPFLYGKGLYIVICPQRFRGMPRRYVAFQMEQTITSRWLKRRYLNILRNAYAVLDYSTVNIRYFKEQTDFASQFYYLPIDYLPNYERPQQEKEYDVVFYGDVTIPRREEMLRELSRDFRVKILMEVYGEELYRELSKAKVIVNLHYYENAMLETTRLYEVLSLGSSVVVSERSSDPEEEKRLEGIVDFVDVGDIAQMKAHIAHWLQDEDARRNKVQQNNRILRERPAAFDYFFYRFLLANGWMTFDRFYELAGSSIQFNGNRVCLSLPESAERLESFAESNRYGFEIFPGLRHIRGWTGCGMSYKFIMRKAIEQGLDKILVCEDDVLFPENFGERFEKCCRYLEENPGWNVFQGLMADVGAETVKKVTHSDGQTYICINHLMSMVFNIYDRSVFRYIENWDENNADVKTNTIDRALEQKNLNIIVTTPFLVGHKEDLNSTVWGFNNSEYSGMISASSEKLEALAEKFEKEQPKD